MSVKILRVTKRVESTRIKSTLSEIYIVYVFLSIVAIWKS